ncbi:hypothetical protein GGS20DRAFT_61339 [Poronia punctata]|nr:hypothetical protein GGS20DRAFT_61339 [Poronia punctata]
MDADSGVGNAKQEPATTVVGCSCLSPEPSLVVIDPEGDLTLVVGEAKCAHYYDGAPKHSRAEDSKAEDSRAKSTKAKGKKKRTSAKLLPEDSEASNRSKQEDDVFLELPVRYRVCSKTMSRTCPAWKVLLSGKFAERRPASSSTASESEWVVALPDDNPKTMEIILNIIHCRFQNVPDPNKPLDMESLYQITVLCDKYDLTALLRPWAQSWTTGIRKNDLLEAPWLEWERTAWISWVLGDLNRFSEVVTGLVLDSYPGPNGDLCCKTKNGDDRPLFTTTLEPPGLVGLITVGRLQAIEALLKLYQDAVAQLLDAPSNKNCRRTAYVQLVFPHLSDGQQVYDCPALALGIMIRSLARKGYRPLPDPKDVPIAFRDLKANLLSVQTADCGCIYTKTVDIQNKGSKMPFDTDFIPFSRRMDLEIRAEKSGI